jgi:hypothetical protein
MESKTKTISNKVELPAQIRQKGASAIFNFCKINDKKRVKLTDISFQLFLSDLDQDILDYRRVKFWPCCGTPLIRKAKEDVIKSHRQEAKTLIWFKKNPNYGAVEKLFANP